MSNINNNNISNPNLYKAASKIILKNLNSSINNLTPEELKFFFKRYHRNKNSMKILNDSETDSTITELPESQNQLNAIYIHNLNSLNQFLQKQKNLKGLTLQGNRLLENISLNKFNEFFREYGKSIEKKLKKHVLNYFYPNNNQPKLMGQKMNLTPIPIKRNIYLKNEKEKKDYKNAERAAVILRRLEYTHGLSGNNNRDEKIFFYLMKGAALIIEDWWIDIYINKKKDEDYNKLLGKIKNLENVSKENNERNNRFILNNKKNKNGKKYNKDMNYKNQALKYRKITPASNLNKKKGKLKKNNKVEVVEINLHENQNSKTNISQTEQRNSAPFNSNDDPIINNSAKNVLIDENNVEKENEINKTSDKINNKENNNSNINNNKNLQKSMSAKHIYGNNKYEIIKEKIIKGNPIQLIVSNSLMDENKNKNKDSNNNKIINNKPSKNKILNRSAAYNKVSQNYNLYKIQMANKKIDLNNLILSKKLEKSSTAPRFISSSVRKDKNFPENNLAKNILNKNKLFDEDNNISKTPNHSNINNNENNNKLEKQKSQKCKVKNKNKSKNKINMDSSGIKLFKQKDIKNKKKKNNNLNNSAFVMENNINISIINDDKKNNNNKEKTNNKLNINISNDDIFNKKENEKNNIKEEIICDNKLEKENKDNNTNHNIKNNSISVVSIIGYKLSKDSDNKKSNSMNNINNKKKNLEINNNNNKINEQEKEDIDINNDKNNIYIKNDFNNENEINNNINNLNNEINNNINNKNKNDFKENNNNIINNNNNYIEIEEPNNNITSEEKNNENQIMNNINNNVIIQIDESNKNNKEKDKVINSKKDIQIPNMILNNKINNIYSLEENNIKNKIINMDNNNEESKNNSDEIEDGSFKFNKNSFFFNNANNVLLVNLDNNSEYDETEIKRIKLKKNYYSRYTTNIIKINMDNTECDIINKKYEIDNICLTDKNTFDKKNNLELIENNEDLINSKQEKEKEGREIHYKIIKNNKNINNKSKPFNALEKTSFEGSVDEIISKHLMKIHNNNDEINKQRIDKAYTKVQLRKSEYLNNNNILNISKDDFNKDKKEKIIKSKSLKELPIKKDDNINNK